MYKSCNVVMLHTNQAQNEDNNTIYLNNFSKELILGWRNARSTNQTVQHLYITSDEEIKVNDWVMLNYRIGKSIDKALPACLKNAFHNADFWNAENKTQNLGNKPIIATTDTSLRLPQLPQEFIQYFIKEYNKGNIITKVEIEYEDKFLGYFPHVATNGTSREPKYEIQLKVNFNNTINIKPIKNSWNRKEVKQLMELAYNEGYSTNGGVIDIDKWIEENLL